MGMGNLQDGNDNSDICEISFHLGLDGDFGSSPFTCIYNFIDSLGQPSLQEGVEQFNQQYQAATKHQQRGSQEDQTNLQVRQRAVHKEMSTCQRGSNSGNNRHCWLFNKKNLIVKMAYILLYGWSRCASPMLFHCPVSYNKQTPE